MNLLSTYSLQAGQKIGKIHTNEKFYPIPFNKYIAFAPFSKQSKSYSYWFDVLSIIHPILDKNGIKILQVGGKDEPKLPFCHHAQGTTNWGQLQYIIARSMMVLSTDTAAAHIAGHFNIPLVDIISNNFKECVSPFYGDKSKQKIIEPDRKTRNPSFSLDEGDNKQIDSIKPEDIAHAVLEVLGLNFEVKYSSLHFGFAYKNRLIESIPDSATNISNLGINNLIVRMDYLFNEEILAQQLSHCRCSIITDRPINPGLLQNFRQNILEVIYVIKESPAPDKRFCRLLFDLKIPCRLTSWLDESELSKYKLDFMDWGIINKMSSSKIGAISDEDVASGKIYFKSNKFLLSCGQIFQSYPSFLEKKNVGNFNPPFELVTKENFPLLLMEQDSLYFVRENY